MKIFYDKRQSVSGLDSFSPSAGKPERFIRIARCDGFDDVVGFEPVNKYDLKLVHSAEYVDGVFDGTILNGFENNDMRVPEACLWTIGSLLAASKHALQYPSPACSPTSGFHHAHHSMGGGFCTFNGLMVVAAKLILENPDVKIAILDCDMHYGDGTADILRKFPHYYRNVMHRTQGAVFYEGDKGFQHWLEHRVLEINEFNPDLVIYQAGADPHINDPLGGLLTNDELALRDKTVFEGIHAGVAWNLAGGYQQPPDARLANDPVLRIHLNTLRAAHNSIAVRASRSNHERRLRPLETN